MVVSSDMFYRVLIILLSLILSETSFASSHVDKIQKFQVNNSDVIFFNKKTQIIDFSIIIRNSGFAYEKINGLNYIAKHLIEMGPSSYKFRDFKNELDENSINFSISSDLDNIYLRVRVLKKNFDEALRLVSMAIFDTNLGDENFKLAKINALNDVKNLRDDFQKSSYKIFLNEVFKNSAYDKKIPLVSEIENIGITEVNDYISGLQNSNYQFICVGDVDQNYIVKLLDKYFSSRKDVVLDRKNDLIFSKEKKEKYIKIGGDNFQSMIYFYYPSYELNDKRYQKIKLFVDYIGGDGLTSVLMKKLREDMNIAYSAAADFVNLNMSHIIVGKAFTSSKEINKILLEIKDIFRQISYNGLNDEELESLKNRFFSKLDMLFIDNTSILNALQFLITNGLSVNYFSEMRDEIKNLSIRDMNQFIKNSIDHDKLFFVVVS